MWRCCPIKNKKKETKKSIIKTIAVSKGFYIALCSVVAIVGFSVYSSRLRADMNKQLAAFDETEWQEVEDHGEVEIIDIDENLAEDNKIAESAPVTGFEKVPEVIETAAVVTQKTEKPKFVMEMPCDGNIIGECSLDDLVYSETMKDWRTHNGIDIAAKVGTQVKAAEAGVVSKVYKDDLYGVLVAIDHENDISSIYANLQSVDFIKVGTKVQKGDIIGGVGESGALEANIEPHLHFEVKAKGEYKHPKEFMKN